MEKNKVSSAYSGYLSAKKGIDDRSLSFHVFQAFGNLLRKKQKESNAVFLEAGCGNGTMIERLLDQKLLTKTDYYAVDMDPANIADAKNRLSCRFVQQGYHIVWEVPDILLAINESSNLKIHFITTDIREFLKKSQNNYFDMIISHAFLDLVSIPEIVPEIRSVLKPEGNFYFSILFDGTTDFIPAINPELDSRIIRLYHQTMENRTYENKRYGTSHSGTQMLEELIKNNAGILEIGSSDWVVFSRNGKYNPGEADFLRFIIDTVHLALKGIPEIKEEELSGWAEKRYAQIDSGKLIYMTHQLDVLGSKT